MRGSLSSRDVGTHFLPPTQRDSPQKIHEGQNTEIRLLSGNPVEMATVPLPDCLFIPMTFIEKGRISVVTGCKGLSRETTFLVNGEETTEQLCYGTLPFSFVEMSF